jgi:hypothetical protein
MLSVYESRMPASLAHHQPFARARAAMGLLALGVVLAGCANMSDSMLTTFADPARYDLYECKQIEPERKFLATRAAELQGLMAKAETGTGGAVVAELAYRNDYITVRAQKQLADEAWQRNKCRETTPGTALPVTPPPSPAAPSRAGGSVY